MSRTFAVLGRRVCALLAVGSATLHALMLPTASSPAATLAVAALLVTMVAVCLFCAWELWRDGALRIWTTVALMNLGMVALHFNIVGSPGHGHGGAAHLPEVAQSLSLMTVATALALTEVAAAAAVLIYRTRDREARLLSGRGELA